MKKIFYLFSLIALYSCYNDLPKFAHKYISATHGTSDYVVISDDTITIPVRRLMSLAFATANASCKLNEDYAAAKTYKERQAVIKKAEEAEEEYDASLLNCYLLLTIPRYDKEDSEHYRVIETRANYRTSKTYIRIEGDQEISELPADALKLYDKAMESSLQFSRNISQKKEY